MNHSIDEMPEEERPREKLREKGTDRLTDTELLSIILRTGTKGINVKQLSGQILSEYSFQRILNVSREDLEDFEGISRAKSGQIKAAVEIARRMQREERNKLESLEDVKSETVDMKLLDKEELRVFMLNSGNEVLKRRRIDGEVRSVNVGIQELLRSAVAEKASAVIIAHNHPSGTSEPTDADRKFTRELKESAEVLGIDLLDHVIIGETVFSFRRDESDLSL